jgi:dTDP-4-amino-4,6-dideoxygalactose transaminase
MKIVKTAIDGAVIIEPLVFVDNRGYFFESFSEKWFSENVCNTRFVQDGIKRPLGSIGHLAAFSFHETKNIQSGEGGLLAINDDRFISRAEVIWEKGTNRAEFFRGEVNKYGWVDIGSSFLPSEVTAAFLWAQLEVLDQIQTRRKQIWEVYHEGIRNWASVNGVSLPFIPDYATNNGHMYYMVMENGNVRAKLIQFLKSNGVYAVFHYLSLHKSEYYKSLWNIQMLQNADHYSDCLVRLPLFYDLKEYEQNQIIDLIKESHLSS